MWNQKSKRYLRWLLCTGLLWTYVQTSQEITAQASQEEPAVAQTASQSSGPTEDVSEPNPVPEQESDTASDAEPADNHEETESEIEEPATALPASQDSDPEEMGRNGNSRSQAPDSADADARNIRFQFDGMPYMDVIQRFSQMVNKPLLADSKIEGTLTFDDPRPYTYQEAFDTLNTILSMKNLMLTEEDRYLRLVPFQKLPQMPLRIFRGLDDTGDASPGEVVTVVLQLKNLDAGDVSKSIANMLSDAGSIAPLSRGTGLIITDRLSNIQRIRSLLLEVDTASPIERTMKTYTLLTASGAVVSDLINKTFGSATAPKRTIWNEQKKSFDTLPPDPNDYVTAVFDEASRTLVLYGPGERVQLAEDLIQRFEDREGGRGGEVKIFFPKRTPATEVARMIRQAVPGVAAENESPTAVSTKARVIVDSAMNRLIVATPISGQMDAIDSLYRKIEADGTSGSGDPETESVEVTRVMQLKNAAPDAVSKVLTNAFQTRAPNGEMIMPLKVTVDGPSRSLILTGKPGDVQRADEILAQLESGWAGVGPLETRVYEMESSRELERLQPMIQQLYTSQVNVPSQPDAAHARFLADAETKRLIVTASELHLKRIDRIVEELRGSPREAAPRQVRTLSPTHVKVDQVLPTLTRLVDERMGEPGFRDLQRPTLIGDGPNNRILITSSQTQFQEIETLLKTLDVGPDRSTREIVRVPLGAMNATQVLPTLNQLMRPLLEAHSNPAARPEVIADSSGRTLFLSGSPSDIEKIRGFIREIQGGTTAAGAVRQFRSVALNRRPAAEVMPVLEQLYREQMRGQAEPPGGAATFVVESRGNRILLVGPEAELERAESLLKQLDPPAESAAREETRVLRLKTAVATDLVGILEKSLNPTEEQVRILVDARSNSLVLSGQTESVEAAAQLVAELDTAPSSGPREMRIIDLKSPDADQMAAMATELFAEMLRDQRGPNYRSQTRIVPDATGRRLIVSGVHEELVLVSDLVDRLDKPIEKSDNSRVFQLNQANAGQVARILNETLVTVNRFGRPTPRVIASADERSNTIVVTGERPDLQAASEIVERLEGEGASGGRMVRAFDVESEDPAQLVQSANEVWAAQFGGRGTRGRNISLTVDGSGRRVIAVAPADLLPQIEELVKALDYAGDGTPRLTEVIELGDQSVSDTLPVLRNLYAEQSRGSKLRPATLMPHPDGTRLVVIGTGEQVAAIRELTGQLKGDSESQERRLATFELRTRENADRLLPMIQQVYRDRMANRKGLGPADAQFLVDQQRARLIVSGRGSHLDLIGEVVQELDSDEVVDERKTRFFEVGQEDDVRQLLPLVQQLYRDQNRDKSPKERDETSILADERGGRIIVTGSATSLKAVEEILNDLRETRSPVGTRQTRVYQLKSTLADELVVSLRALYAEELKNVPGVTAQALILPDSVGNRLLISGRDRELEILEPLIKKLDDVTPQTANTRIFKLKSASVTQVSAILSSALVTVERGGFRTTPRVSVGADPASNTLVVSGQLQDLNAAASIIEQLDDADQVGPREIRIFPLKGGRAADMANFVKALYSEQIKDRRGAAQSQAIILPDPISDRLLVTASQEDLTIIEEIVGTLDEMSDQASRQLQVLTLPGEDGPRVAGLLNQFFSTDIQQTDPLRRLTLTALPDQRTLVLEATRPLLRRVQTFITQVTAAGEQGEPTRSTRAFAVGAEDVQRVTGLLRSLYENELKGSRPGENADAQFLPDPSTGRLLVTGRKAHLEMIESLLPTAKPQEGSGERVTRLLSVGSSNQVQRLLPLVQQLYRDELKGLESVEAADAQILADANAGRLIVTGRSNQVERVARILERLQGDTPGSESRDTRIYSLAAAAAQDLADTVNELFEQELKGRPGTVTDRALILPDPMSNRLIVSGPVDQLDVIEGIVKKLDQVTTQTGGARVFRLKFAEPDQVASILSSALVQQERGRNRPVSRVSVGIDSANRTLVLSGETRDINAAAAIIEQLDAQPDQEPRRIRILPVTPGRATDLANKVRQVYDEQRKTLPKGDRGEALILGDMSSDRLILTASAESLQMLEEILRELDPADGSESRQLRVVRLQRNSAASVASVANQLFVRDVSQTDLSRRLMISSTPDDRTLVVEGPGETLGRLEELIGQLDAAKSEESYQVRAYQLGEARAGELAPALARLFSERNPTPAVAGLQPRFEADVASNVLMVGATPDQFERIEGLIDELKARVSVSGEVRTFKLVNSDATQVATILTTMLDAEPEMPFWMRGRFGGRPAEPQGGKVHVAAAPAVNAVVVQGPPATLRTAEQIIRNLDGESDAGGAVIQSVRLKKAAPEAVAEAVNRAITNRGASGKLNKARVTAVTNSSMVLVDGPPDAVNDILKIIRDLDEDSVEGDVEIRIFKLENGRARELSVLLNQMLRGVLRDNTRSQPRRGGGFGGGFGGGGGLPENVVISVDERSNSLIISARPDQFAVIEKVLVTLDQSGEASERNIQFVWLKNTRAIAAQTRLEAIYEGRPRDERPVIDADIYSNSLTLVGRREDLREIEALINQMEEGAGDGSTRVRLLVIETLPAEEMADMLLNLFPQMSGTQIRVVDKLPTPPPRVRGRTPGVSTNALMLPTSEKEQTNGNEPPVVYMAVDKNSNALLLSGAAEDLTDVSRIVDEIVFANLGSDAEFRLFPLKDADPVAVSRVLNELFKPEPIRNPQPRQGEPPVITPSARMTVVPEPRTRSLVVRGKATDFILLQSLLEKLDVKGELAEMQFESVPIQHADLDKISPLVNQAVQQLTSSRPGEQIFVTSDPRTRSLFVGARAPVLVEVKALIEGLDTPAAFAEADMLIVPLKNAVATQVVNLLQTMLRPNTSGEVTAEARELQEQIRRLNVRRDDGTTIELDLRQPIKLMAETASGGARTGNRVLITSTPDNAQALAAVIAMMDRVSVGEGVGFKLVRLERADAATVAQTLTSIFQQGQRLTAGPAGPVEPEGEVGRALTSPLNVAVDVRSNSVILSGRQEPMNLAMDLIKDLDGDFKGYKTTVKLFAMKYASAIQLAPLLQAVFTEGAPVPGAEGMATFVTRLQTALGDEPGQETVSVKGRAALTIQPHIPSNSLLIAARSDMMPLIEEVLGAMDVPAATGMDAVRIYPLKHADPSRVSTIINELYASRASLMRPEERPTMSVDPRTSALIVTGNEGAFGFVEALLAQLDRELPEDLGDFRFVKLENAEATTVATVLQRLMDSRMQQKAAMGLQRPESLRVLIIAEPRSNGIVVAGSKDSFSIVESLAKQLDVADSGLAGDMRIIPLEHANAGNLGQMLTTLFNQRYQMLRSVDAQRRRPIIIPDTRMNALLVAAGLEDSKALDAVVEKLDRKPENPAVQVEVIPLRQNDAARVAALLTRFFSGRLTSLTPQGQPIEPQERVTVESDPLSNSLIVSANRENMEMARGLIDQVDKEPSVEGSLVQIVPLKNTDAQRAATMLRGLIQQGLYRPGMGGGTRADLRSREALAIGVDGRANALIVSASPENMQVIKQVIEHIDSDAYEQDGDIQLFTLEHARASQLGNILEQFFRSKRAAEATANVSDRMVPVTVTADDRTNTLIVTGDRTAFAAVERMLRQLDVVDVFDRTNFRVFVLKNGTASKMQSTLQRLFQNRPARVTGTPAEPINIVADSWANALVVGASSEDMVMVASLIDTLDAQPADGAMQVRVLPLAKADARSVSQTILGLYRDSPGAPASVGVNVDDRINAIVVSAGEQDMVRIEELVRKLDTDVVARISEIRIFPLRYAQAEELAQVLTLALTARPDTGGLESPARQSMLQFITRTPEGEQLVASALKESLLIVSDRRRNALVVSAPLESMNLLSRLIQTLDSEAPQLAKIKMFKLANADARQMADLLISLFRLQQVPGQPTNTRAIQYVLDLEGGARGLSATIGSAEQYALTVTVDLRTNALLIGGSDHYVDLASGIIQDLDSTPAMERRSVVYRLRNARAEEVELALRSFLDQNRQQLTTTLGDEGIGTSQRLLEMEVAIVAENTSNTLLLSASPQYFDQFKDLIEELDQPLPQVLIQVILAEVTLDKSMEFGVEWAVSGRRGSAQGAVGTDLGVAQDLQSFGGFSSAVSGNDFGFLMRALQVDGRLEVLSRPQVLTADNQLASIDVGQLVPLISGSRVDQFQNVINTFAYTNVGVRLTVTPRISPDGYIRMEVEPTISQLTTATVDVAPGVRAPIINQRTARTTVSVQNGQSIVIGGLISTSDDQRVKKVPVLGDIPYVGSLFRSTRNLQDRKELIIILTPQLLSGGSDAKRLSSEQFMRSTVKDQLNRDSLQRQILEPILPHLSDEPVVVPETPPTPPPADNRRRPTRRGSL